MTQSHPLVELARRAIEAFVLERRQIQPPEPLTAEMRRKAGAFVTCRRFGQLRGCIGTLEPVHENLADEVIHNAISSASRDPRFAPIGPDELEDLEIKVDVLSEPEPVLSEDELNPSVYGLIVQSTSQPWKRGVLLPDLAGIDTVEQQVYWTRVHKAGITDPYEPVQMFRFTVNRLS